MREDIQMDLRVWEAELKKEEENLMRVCPTLAGGRGQKESVYRYMLRGRQLQDAVVRRMRYILTKIVALRRKLKK